MTLFLQILASYGKQLDTFITEDRIPVFNCKGDKGLPQIFDTKLKSNNPKVFDLAQLSQKIGIAYGQDRTREVGFEKVQNVLKGNFHPYSNRKNFHFNNMIICEVCGCKVLEYFILNMLEQIMKTRPKS